MSTEVVSEIDTRVGLDMMQRMLLVRRFEERVEALAKAGEINASVHLYIGQEAIAAGVCAVLRDDDYITSTHRGHGHLLSKGAEVNRCMAELFGRATGYCKGKGGSMHVTDIEHGIIGANGIVGAGNPIATGAALSAKLRGTDQVSICFFGEGASNQGTFHESLNLAAIWTLPVVYVCENNGWNECTRMERVTAQGAIAPRADGYGVPNVTVDGNDAFAVHAAASEAVGRARAGQGPTLIEALTWRIREHSYGIEMIVGGPTQTEDDLAPWVSRDPIAHLRRVLISAGVDAGELDSFDRAATAEIASAVDYSRSSPLPDPSSAFTDLWLDPVSATHEQRTS